MGSITGIPTHIRNLIQCLVGLVTPVTNLCHTRNKQ